MLLRLTDSSGRDRLDAGIHKSRHRIENDLWSAARRRNLAIDAERLASGSLPREQSRAHQSQA